jgi:uncharacterized protein with von Willebrand factor type A (vWA) domain
LSEPLFETGDLSRSLQEILAHGVRDKLKGLEALLTEAREIKASVLQDYNLKPALQALQNHHQNQARMEVSLPDPIEERNGARIRGTKGGAHLFDLSEVKRRVKDSSACSAGYLVSLLQNLMDQCEFTGSKSLASEKIPWLMDRMALIFQVERDLQRAIWGYDLNAIDGQNISELLGEEARGVWEALKKMKDELENSGLLQKWKNNYRLSQRGFSILSGKILKEIFALIRLDLPGKHPARSPGERGIDLTNSRPYSFGLPLHLNLSKTLMNTLIRNGRGSPLRPKPEDFEIYNVESLSRTASVLMLDMSQSMKDRNNFRTAKKVAIALNELIRRKFPRDHLEIVGFSTTAKKFRPHELPYLLWNAEQSYTNIQEGLRLSRQILRSRGYRNNQIILITDGEPTAHSEGGKLYFQFPPHPRTIKITLDEVKRCTREEILIHTFMLAKSNPLTNFVDEVTKINPGRPYYTDSDHLGEHIVVDYLQQKEQMRGAPKG